MKVPSVLDAPTLDCNVFMRGGPRCATCGDDFLNLFQRERPVYPHQKFPTRVDHLRGPWGFALCAGRMFEPFEVPVAELVAFMRVSGVISPPTSADERMISSPMTPSTLAFRDMHATICECSVGNSSLNGGQTHTACTNTYVKDVNMLVLVVCSEGDASDIDTSHLSVKREAIIGYSDIDSFVA
eukprot:6192779-Pleurochrysis_carterae.AAC.5